MPVEYLFVYGTLMSDYDDKISHNYVARYAELVGKATMQGKMFMVDYYPGVVETTEKLVVKGELYQVNEPEPLFSFLDKYEEFLTADEANSEYIRKKTTVKLKSSGKEFDAWVYFYNQSTEHLEQLPKGDFINEYHK